MENKNLEDKGLLIRRMLYAAVFCLSLLFISFYGGNVPYMLFWAIVLNFFGMILYILYVFFTVKIFQTLTKRQIMKKELVPYQLLLHNESMLAYRDIRLEFIDVCSKLNATQTLGRISLEPGEGIQRDMELFCEYSGTYYVGVDTIEIMDYFKIFRIRFSMPQKMKVTVKPRILITDNLSFLTQYEQCHDVSQKKTRQDMLDNTVKKYVPGDSMNLIHWKNSAKRQELMMRTMVSEDVFKYVIILDGVVSGQELERMIQCDKLRELSLALISYVYRHGYQADTYLGSQYRYEISERKELERFYEQLTEYEFSGKENMDVLLESLHKKYENSISFVVITANDSLSESKSISQLKYVRRVHLLNVNSFDDIEEFLQV